MDIVPLMRPARSLAVATDVLAGYCVASSCAPRAAEAAAAVPFLFAGAALLGAAGEVFDACFAPALDPRQGRAWRAGAPSSLPASPVAVDSPRWNAASLKGTFLAGSALAVGGLFAAMAAVFSAGKLPAYFAAFMFLVSWARAGRGPDAVLGPVARGMERAFAMGLGMSAHPELVYMTRPEPLVAAALAFANGALAEVIAQAEEEGGRRYLLVIAAAGLLAVFAAGGVVLMRRPLAWIVAASGAALVAGRALPAVRSLLPPAVRSFGEAAALGSCFLNSALCFGTWPAEGAVLVLGGAALAAVVPCAALFGKYSGAGPLGRAREVA